MEQISQIKDLIDSIKQRVESMCRDVCKEHGIDSDKVLGKDDSNNENSVEESGSRWTPGIWPKQDNSAQTKAKNPWTEKGRKSSTTSSVLSVLPKHLTQKRLKNEFDANMEMHGAWMDESSMEDDDIEIDFDDNSDSSAVKTNYMDMNSSDDGIKTNYMDVSGNDDDGDTDGEDEKKPDGSVIDMAKEMGSEGAKVYGGMKIAKNVGKGVGKKVFGIGSKTAAKAAGKTVGKVAGKSLLKGIPIIGSLVGVPFAYRRWKNGDNIGALMELASGAGGLSTSLGIEAALAARDAYKETHDMGESTIDHLAPFSLYDRAKFAFESEHGVNESGDDFVFDDYVRESRANNGLFIGESETNRDVFFGYGALCEAVTHDEDELERLIRRISADGKITYDELISRDTDTDDIKRIKSRIRELYNKIDGSGKTDTSLNFKELKKARDMSMDQSGKPTNIQMWHNGLDNMGNAINDKMAEFGLSQEYSKKLNIPKNIARLAGAGIGGLMFGPLGAIGGTALANWIANRHEKYKTDQYNKLHGTTVESPKDEYVGSLAGAGIGSLLAGPVGGIVGAGLGHIGSKVAKAIKDHKGKSTEDTNRDEDEND